jgi:hypothetical protein
MKYQEFVSSKLKNQHYATKQERGDALRQVAQEWQLHKRQHHQKETSYNPVVHKKGHGVGKKGKKGRKGKGPIGALIGSLGTKLFTDNDLYSTIGGLAGSFLPF